MAAHARPRPRKIAGRVPHAAQRRAGIAAAVVAPAAAGIPVAVAPSGTAAVEAARARTRFALTFGDRRSPFSVPASPATREIAHSASRPLPDSSGRSGSGAYWDI